MPNLSDLTDEQKAYLFNIAKALLIFAAVLLLARFGKGLLLRLAKRGRISVNVAALLGNLMTIGVVLLGAVFILPIFGVEWTGLLTLVGAIGIAISLALQDVLRNFVSGIYMLIERPFKIGDVITVKEVTGTVQSIELRTTLLRTEDGTQVIVPNATVFTEVVTNQSAYNLQRQVLEISTTTQTLEQMVSKVNTVLHRFDEVATNPSPETSVVSIEGGRMQLRVTYWIKPGSNVASQIAVALRGESPTIEIKLPLWASWALSAAPSTRPTTRTWRLPRMRGCGWDCPRCYSLPPSATRSSKGGRAPPPNTASAWSNWRLLIIPILL